MHRIVCTHYLLRIGVLVVMAINKKFYNRLGGIGDKLLALVFRSDKWHLTHRTQYRIPIL